MKKINWKKINKKPVFLITRTDGIGDLVLTVPLTTLIKKKYQNSKIFFLVKKYSSEVVEMANDIDDFIIFDPKEHSSLKGLIKLGRKLKKYKVDIAISVRPKLSIALLFLLMKIPIRIGTARRAYSFLYTHRVSVKRKKGGHHETYNNTLLLKPLEIKPENKIPDYTIPTDAMNKISHKFNEWKFDASDLNIITIHPGSMGSALRWPFEAVIELGEMLLRNNYIVLLTGGQTEKELLNSIQKEILSKTDSNFHSKIKIIYDLSLTELTALYKKSSLVIANSTGPLHVAAMIGTPTISIFPMSRATRPYKWHPLGNGTNITIQPDIPNCLKCVEEKCEYYNCLKLIRPEFVFNEINMLLYNNAKKNSRKEDKNKGWIPIKAAINSKGRENKNG